MALYIVANIGTILINGWLAMFALLSKWLETKVDEHFETEEDDGLITMKLKPTEVKIKLKPWEK